MPVSLDINSKDMVELVDRLGQCFHWLRSKNVHMYVGKTELTIEKLEKATKELEVRLNVAMDYMYEALRNGWSLKRLALEWIEQGLVYIGHADEVIDKYKNHQRDDSTASDLLHCPCETLSRRTINSRAILRLNDILDHTDAGKKYHAEEEGGMEAVATTGQRGAGAIRSDDCDLEERFARLVSLSVSQGLRNEPTTFAVPPADGYYARAPSPVVNGHHQRESLAPSDIQKMKLSGLAKYHAFPRAESLPCVPVMIRVNAPAHTRRSRAAIDLVMVLDANARMKVDGKFDQLKQGCMFVILNLDVRDRLSIVTFRMKKQEFTLKSMSADGKTLANKFVRHLKAHAYGEKRTEANEAMERAYEILGEPDGNPVRSVLLLADGQHETILEESLKSTEVLLKSKYPTYTFGFGRDHDPRTLYYLATSGYGTYSFVTESRSIRDAMALCIGGLTSIVAQDVKVTIRSAHEDVEIQHIMSGGHDCRRRRVASGGISSGFTIDVIDLYASEEKKFIVYVNVPQEEAAAAIFPAGTPKTKLLAVTATYYCPLTRTAVSTDTVEVSVERPRKLPATDRGMSVDVEVAGELIRADMFNRVEKVWLESTPCTSYMNLRVPCKMLRRQLTKLQKSIGSSEMAREARERWDDLATDLENMKDISNIGRFSIESTGEAYLSPSPRITGLPYMLSWLSSHRWQRAATPGSSSKSRWFNFRTTRMQNMIDSVDIAPIAL
ncbi:uncharacterized protein [Miscanthus floridulus]